MVHCAKKKIFFKLNLWSIDDDDDTLAGMYFTFSRLTSTFSMYVSFFFHTKIILTVSVAC